MVVVPHARPRGATKRGLREGRSACLRCRHSTSRPLLEAVFGLTAAANAQTRHQRSAPSPPQRLWGGLRRTPPRLAPDEWAAVNAEQPWPPVVRGSRSAARATSSPDPNRRCRPSAATTTARARAVEAIRFAAQHPTRWGARPRHSHRPLRHEPPPSHAPAGGGGLRPPVRTPRHLAVGPRQLGVERLAPADAQCLPRSTPAGCTLPRRLVATSTRAAASKEAVWVSNELAPRRC